MTTVLELDKCQEVYSYLCPRIYSIYSYAFLPLRSYLPQIPYGSIFHKSTPSPDKKENKRNTPTPVRLSKPFFLEVSVIPCAYTVILTDLVTFLYNIVSCFPFYDFSSLEIENCAECHSSPWTFCFSH